MPQHSKSVTIMSSTGASHNVTSQGIQYDSFYGYTDGLGTFQAIYDNFVGRFRIQATLSIDPTEADYFDVIPQNVEISGSPNTPVNHGWNSQGFVEFSVENPGIGGAMYVIQGNYTHVRVLLDRSYLPQDGTNYGQIQRVLLSS